MNLSKNFTLEELIRSATAERMGVKNVPGDAETENLRNLCARVLQPVRDSLKAPIRISSGYRCPALNKAVGGVETSQHLRGEAADIAADGYTARELFNHILSMNLEFDQMILYANFVHISRKRNRQQKLYAKGIQP